MDTNPTPDLPGETTDATTGRSVAAHTSRSRSRFGPVMVPSRPTSVTT